jgi:hypothetical protein
LLLAWLIKAPTGAERRMQSESNNRCGSCPVLLADLELMVGVKRIANARQIHAMGTHFGISNNRYESLFEIHMTYAILAAITYQKSSPIKTVHAAVFSASSR